MCTVREIEGVREGERERENLPGLTRKYLQIILIDFVFSNDHDFISTLKLG